MMKILASVEIGTEGKHCWLCEYFVNGGLYCQLFRVRLAQVDTDPPLRCAICLEAGRQPGLFPIVKENS